MNLTALPESVLFTRVCYLQILAVDPPSATIINTLYEDLNQHS